ncbi:MAG: RNA polymerase factor sigma-54 [Firmicutes bacterium]|nr:RNA polymerase factor sigma-54 [Bacillota bacterium]
MDLTLNTSQKLLLSQKMLQSTEILQMSSTELADYIKEAAVENPVMELEEKQDDSEKFDLLRKKIDYINESDEQNRTYYTQEKDDEDENDDWKFKQNSGQSLEEYLSEQLNCIPFDKNRLAIGHYIIGCINSNGYLEVPPEAIAKNLKADVQTVKDLLGIIKTFEPTGVGASSLQECLELQLDKVGCKDDTARAIVRDYLELLGKNQLHVIAKKLRTSLDDVIEASAKIKSLNPKPGNSFDSGKSLDYITPDALIHEKDGAFEIILNDHYMPGISISSFYKTIVKDSDDTEAKNYINEKIRQAEWIMKCISKRNSTLKNTIEVIVDIQNEFFLNGKGSLKPMCLNDVAAALGIHESTVSRAVKDKYVQCRHGIYPLNYFFKVALPSADSSGSLTAEAIKLMIKNLIDEEDNSSPLSDREITEKLNDSGISISRRTVAKYRESMGILGTSGRKN